MRKTKYVPIKVRKQDNGTYIVETQIRDNRPPCRECGKNPRQEASSRCKECSQKKVTQDFSADRLARRIEEAKKTYSPNP